MQTTKLLLAFLCANAPVIAGDEAPVTPAAPVSRQKAFEYHFGTLRGSSLQPASGLQRGTMQPAAGLQLSASERGANPAVSTPTSDEEWRRMFPKKLAEK